MRQHIATLDRDYAYETATSRRLFIFIAALFIAAMPRFRYAILARFFAIMLFADYDVTRAMSTAALTPPCHFSIFDTWRCFKNNYAILLFFICCYAVFITLPLCDILPLPIIFALRLLSPDAVYADDVDVSLCWMR